MPSVSVIDMRAEKAGKGNTIFSRDLVSAIYDRLNKKEQIIIFLNRRGFATHLTCYACGYTASCKNCSVDYTYHRSKDYLACHICGEIIEAPQNCPQCKAQNIKYSGVGTEKIEDIATKLFPFARISRMDSDTMTNRKSYEDILLNFRRGKIDILIGTQMLAKGLDFPNVTLVGIVNADLSLHIPDFRAAERTFQLLTQVAGRAGRGAIPGEVFIQTYTPFHEAIKYAVNHDYEAFYNYEIPIREELSYPPKTHLVVIRFSGENEDRAFRAAEEFVEKLSTIRSEHLIFSPLSPSPISKIKNKFRYSVMLRGNLSSQQKNFIKSLIFGEFKNKNTSITVDIDALNLM
jgi:primosomal protein N' (replication factor Y)